MTEDKYSFVPIPAAIVPPPGLINHMKDRWWVVHPEKGLAFYGSTHSPQCNSDESIVRRLAKSLEWAEVRFIPSVFHAINPNDYV